MNDVYFKASLQNTLNPEVGTFDNVSNKEGTFTLEDGEYYLTNNTSSSYRVYYPIKDIYSVGFTIEFDINYPGSSDFEWCLGFNGDDSTYWFGIGIWKANLEFRGQTLPNYHLIASTNTWLHVKCIFDYYNSQNKVHIYVNNSEVNTFTISKDYGIKHIDILGNKDAFASKAKIKNIVIYNSSSSSKKHYLDTTGLTSLWSKIKSIFATKTELASNFYTKKQIDIMLESGSGGGTDWTGARVYHVGQGTGMYPSIQAAVTAILAGTVPTYNNRAVIMLWPGKYDMTAKVTIPAYTGVKGVSKGLVQLYNNTTDMFQCSDHVWFEDLLIEGAPTASLYAFDCNNASHVHVRRVDMLNNGGMARQKFLKQVGSTWMVLFIEDCIIDYRATSDYAVLLQNSSGVARFCDVNINDVFFDAYGLTTSGGSFLVRACQDVRFKRSTIRGAATWNTGIRLEKSDSAGTPSIEVKHCDMANVQNDDGGVSISSESGTTVYLTNSDCPNSSFGGTVVNRNSNVT